MTCSSGPTTTLPDGKPVRSSPTSWLVLEWHVYASRRRIKRMTEAMRLILLLAHVWRDFGNCSNRHPTTGVLQISPCRQLCADVR